MEKNKSEIIYSSFKKIFPIIIFVITIFMSVGFAAVNSVIFGFNGEAVAKNMDGIYILEAKYLSDVDADIVSSKILSAYQTNLTSVVSLSKTNGNSSITYQISIYNSTDLPYSYNGTTYIVGESTYDNQSIIHSVAGLNLDDVIQSKETKTFTVTFRYNNNVVAANNILNSIINFKFVPYEEEQEEILTSAGVLNNNFNDGSLFGSNLYKSSIESVSFVNHENYPAGATTWDATANHNGTITGWYVDSDGDGLYEVYIGADSGRITLPENCSNMFYWWGSLTTIDFSNVDTSQVTNMSYMFYYSSKLTELDLRRFDTTNVTNMSQMFAYISSLSLVRLDNATFDNVTTYSMMFYQVPAVVVVKDDVVKNWINTKPLAYNYYGTTVKTVAEYTQ